MSEHTIHGETDVVTVRSADELFLWQNSTGRTGKATAAELLSTGGVTVTSATTSATLTDNGISIGSTLLSSLTLAAPSQAGLTKQIIFPSSTAVRTVTASGAVTFIGSTISPSSAQVLTITGTSDAKSGSVTVTSPSTTQWAIAAAAGTVMTSS